MTSGCHLNLVLLYLFLAQVFDQLAASCRSASFDPLSVARNTQRHAQLYARSQAVD